MKNEAPNEQNSTSKEVSVESIIADAVKVPGVKVERNRFLAEIFAADEYSLQNIIDLGPVQAGVSQEMLSALSQKLILKRTSYSSAASFAAGLPGGVALAATIPADVLQFFVIALRLAQELSYLYGAQDLWKNGQLDDEKVKSQLILYCGVMFGVSGAASGVRVLSSQIAKTTLKKLPQQALTKTFWYPIVKQIGNAVGVKITKSSVAAGVSKAVPVIGGVVSGGLNFASMFLMANRLQTALDSASFGYSQEEFEQDIIEIESLSDESANVSSISAHTSSIKTAKVHLIENGKNALSTFSGLLSKKTRNELAEKSDDIIATITKLAELKERGLITQEEFDTKKTELLSRL